MHNQSMTEGVLCLAQPAPCCSVGDKLLYRYLQFNVCSLISTVAFLTYISRLPNKQSADVCTYILRRKTWPRRCAAKGTTTR